MVELMRVKVNWTGFVGAPGYTNLYFRDPSIGPATQTLADAAVVAVDTWLDAWVSYIPSNVSFLVDPTVDVVDEFDGSLVNLFTTVPDSSRVGTASGTTYVAAAGAVVNWKTASIRDGRKMRGRTFFVPLAGSAYDNGGSIDNTKLTAMRSATSTFISSFGTTELVVWGRPRTPGATNGVAAPVTGFTIPDMSAVLRSRRD